VLLAVNVGNTATALALFAGETRVAAWRLGSARARTADELAVVVRSLMADADIDPDAVDGVAVASVVPPLVPTWRRLSADLFGRVAYVYGDDGRYGIEVRLDMPASQVGADRLCNAVAARRLVGAPALVVDVGTATTLDVVAPDGAFVGGAIAPGPLTAAEGLVARAARLPRFEVAAPAAAIGGDTAGALQAGVVLGAAGAVDALVRAARRELGAPDAPAIVTGGLAVLIGAKARAIDRVEPWLTLDGLRMMAQT
jgi:type III pantothenate kinase